MLSSACRRSWSRRRPSWPRWPSFEELRLVLTGSPDVLAGALVRPIVWLTWVLWAYLAVAIGLSAGAHGLDRLGLSGSRHLFGLRRRLVPPAICAVIDAVMIASLAMGPKSPRSSWAHEAVAATRAPVASVSASRAGSAPPSEVAVAAEYVVRRGDTLSEIAAKECESAGKWPSIWEANKGRELAPGQVFEDPHLIRPGWPLALPDDCEPRPDGEYVVQPGDSLAKIARTQLGDESRWPEIWEQNRGQVVGDDGEVFKIERYVRPGWRLEVPTSEYPSPASGAPPAPAIDQPPKAAGEGLPTASPEPPTTSEVARPGPAATPAPQAPASPLATAEPPTPGTTTSATEGESPMPPASDARSGPVPGVRVPWGAVLPASAAAAVLAAVARAKAQRLRRWRADRPRKERPAGLITRAIRRAGTAPSMDLVGPLTERLCEVWSSHAQQIPPIAAAWERPDGSFSFLLSTEAEALPAASADKLSGVELAFHRQEGATWAVASRPAVPGMRREIYAFADGLLVPVGARDEGWLLLPLLGSPVSVSGPGAVKVVEAMVVAGALRAREEELRLVVAGNVGVFEDAAFPEGVELPELERVGGEQLGSLRQALEEEVLGRTRYGVERFCDWAFEHPDDRMPAWILVMGSELAQEWRALLEEGARVGVAALVVGEVRDAERRLRLAGGELAAAAPEVGEVGGLVPFTLPDGVVSELTEAAGSDDAEPEVEDLAPEDEAPGDELLEEQPEASPPGVEEPSVKLFLLGGFRGERAGEDAGPLRERAKARELLAHLALYPKGVPAEDLCATLWSEAFSDWADDEREPDRRRNLRVCVSAARDWLEGPDRAKGKRGSADGSLIRQIEGRYRLDLERVWVDTVAFEEAIREAKRARNPKAALQRAVRFYGGPLLEGQDRKDQFVWLDHEPLREAFRNDYLWAVRRLAEILQEEGRPEQALEVLAPALRGDEVCEALERLAMSCEGELPPRGLKDREAVQRRYSRLSAKVRRMFGPGYEPEPETYELYARLLNQRGMAKTG